MSVSGTRTLRGGFIQDVHTIKITSRTAGVNEASLTLDERCKGVMVRIPTDSDAGASQANTAVRVSVEAGGTANGANHIKVEHGASFSWAEVERDVIYYRRQGGTDIEIEIIEQIANS